MANYKDPASIRLANMATSEETLSDFLATYKLETKYNQALILTKWEQLVGATVATRTQKITFKDGTMYVYLTSAPLKHQLTQQKTLLIKLINEAINKTIITEMIFM